MFNGSCLPVFSGAQSRVSWNLEFVLPSSLSILWKSEKQWWILSFSTSESFYFAKFQLYSFLRKLFPYMLVWLLFRVRRKDVSCFVSCGHDGRCAVLFGTQVRYTAPFVHLFERNIFLYVMFVCMALTILFLACKKSKDSGKDIEKAITEELDLRGMYMR